MLPSRCKALCRVVLLGVALPALAVWANDQSGIATSDRPCLESDLKALLQSCIASNKANPPPGNPGPFTRGYKEIVVIMGQCFSGGFNNLTSLGDNVIVGAAADPQKVSRGGMVRKQNSTDTVMLWADPVIHTLRTNRNTPLKDILDAVRMGNPDPLAMTPPPAVSPGGAGIVVGDPMNNLQPSNSFHAVLFAGFNDLAGKEVGQIRRDDWLKAVGSAAAMRDMRATLQFFLNVPGTNIQIKGEGTYADLGAMITNVWAKMNDKEQFILFIADHGARLCAGTNFVPAPGGHGFSLAMPTPAYLKEPDVRNPSVRVNTTFVGTPGEVGFNGTPIGILPVSPGPASHEFALSPLLIRPTGVNNTIDVLVPNADAGVTSVELSSGPVFGGGFDHGAEPSASVINVRNATGANKTDFHIVLDGQLDTNAFTRARRTQADGTPLEEWADVVINYDPAARLTTISWDNSSDPIPASGYASFSVARSAGLVAPLKYAWTPPSPSPENDLAPVNNIAVTSVTDSNLVFTIAAVPLLTSTQTVAVSFRYSTSSIPIEQFYFTNPIVMTLPSSPTQTVALVPDTFVDVANPLPAMSPSDPLPTIIVDSLSAWNGGPGNDVWKLDQINLLPGDQTQRLNRAPGGDASLSVAAPEGSTIQWYKDGQPIPGAVGLVFTLSNLTSQDSGIYTGIADTGVGTIRQFYVLKVQGQADLKILAGAPAARIVPGSRFTQNFTVLNIGTEAAANAIVQATLPAQFNSLGPPSTPAMQDPNDPQIVWYFLDRVNAASTKSGSVMVEVRHDATPGTYPIFFEVSADNDFNADNNQVTLKQPVGIIDLTGDPTRLDLGDPVGTFALNLHFLEPPDLHLGGPGVPVFFERYYDSALSSDGLIQSALGHNWQHNYDLTLSVNATNATVGFRQGRILRFQHDGTNWNQVFNTQIGFRLVETGGGFLLGDPRSQWMYFFNAQGQLARIEDGRGNTNLLTYGSGLQSVSDGLGRTLTFTYNANGLLTNVTDGVRSVRYGHTGTNLTSFTDANGKVTSYAYDAANTNQPGLMTARTLPEGNTPVTQIYDDAGRVVLQADAAGNTNTLAYSLQDGNISTTMTDPLGHTLTHVYRASGELIRLTDEAGQSITVGNDLQGRRSSVLDRNLASTTLAYNASNGLPTLINHAANNDDVFTYTPRAVNGIDFFDLTSDQRPDNSQDRYGYDAQGNLVVHTNRNLHVSRFGYNARGQLLAATNPMGGVARFTYDASARLASAADSDVGVTTFAYDASHRLTRVTHPNPDTIQFSYDALDRLTSITDERTNTTRFVYDDNSRVTATTNALNQASHFEYDGLDRLVRTVDRLGHAASFAYDPRSQLASVTNRNGFVTRFQYDARRRLTALVNPAGKTNQFGYDNEGLLTAASNPLGETVRLRRDPMGYVTNFTDPLGNAVGLQRDQMKRVSRLTDPLGRFVTYAYDARGLLTVVTRGAGPLTRADYTYDALGNLTRIEDPNGRFWNFAYTPMGRMTNFTDPLSRETRYTYDARGRLATVTFPDGVTQTNTYDGANNLTRMQFSDGTDLNFAYDALDRLTHASGSPVFEFTYDAMDRVVNTRQDGVDLGAAYDADGRLTSVTYPNPAGGPVTVTYAYDSRDRLVSVSDNLTGTSLTFAYDEADRLTGVTRPNGVQGAYTYDARGLVTRIQEGSLLDLRYAYDASGQCGAADFVAAPIDPTSAVTSGTNRFSYDNASQISATGYQYDRRGRLTNAPNTAFTWDGASRLRSIDTVSFGYNALGEIVTRAESGTTIRYFYNYAIGLAPIMAERNDNTGQFTRFYAWSPGGLLLYIINLPGNTVHFPLFDRVGSTLALTDGTGAVTDAYAYNAYGRLLARTGNHPQPFQFVGRSGVRSEPAGHLAHMRARYYDPRTARFLSREPVWPELEEPRKLNPYQYALQDPLGFIDPEGTDEKPAERPVEEMSETELAIELFNRAVDRAERRPQYERGPPRGKLSEAEKEKIAKEIKDYIKKLKRSNSKWLEELRKAVKRNREIDKQAEERERARREEENRRYSEEMERRYRDAQRQGGGSLIGPPVSPGGSQPPNPVIPVPPDPTTPTGNTSSMLPQSPSPMSLSPKVRSLMIGPNGALMHQSSHLFNPFRYHNYRNVLTDNLLYQPDGPSGDFLTIQGDIR